MSVSKKTWALALGAIIIPLLGTYAYRMNRAKTLLIFQSPGDVTVTLTSDQSLVGAATIDITPPPRGSAGYSVGGKDSQGFRTRLKARAFYIKPHQGPAAMLIQMDLLSGSVLLHHKIAATIQATTGVSPAALVLSGTHSHGGPGNFFGSDFYNDWAGSQSGLDLDFLEFLSDRISNVALEAYENRREGTVTSGTAVIKGLTRNRSLAAYLANKNIPLTDAKDAINPKLTMLRFDAWHDGQFEPLGAFASFSIHGTSVLPSEVYSADLFHYPASLLSKRLSANTTTPLPWQPIFALVNGTHGDNSPDWHEQGFRESSTIGSKLADHMWTLFKSLTPKAHTLTTRVSTTEVDMILDRHQASSPLCQPRVGMALLGGAEDFSTPILSQLPGFQEGWPQSSDANPCQREKRIAGSVLQSFVLREEAFPRYAMVQTLKIDDNVFLSLPFEVTLEAGRRLAAPLNKVAREVTVLSCSNGYLGYLTTPEEFSQQHYEGAHNLYGPRAADYFTTLVAAAANHLKQKDFTSRWQPWQFQLGSRKGTAIDLLRMKTEMKVLSMPKQNVADGESYLAIQWRHSKLASMAWHLPLLSVETKQDSRGWLSYTDDEGDRLEVRFIEESENAGVYEGRLYGTLPAADMPLRFVIMGASGQKPLYVERPTTTKDLAH